MPLGEFPLRYLGVPLTSKKPNYAQCKPILDSIAARFHHWANFCLSYGGRVTLIKSVVSGMQAFWGKIFILPKKSSSGQVKVILQTKLPYLGRYYAFQGEVMD